MTDLVKVRTVEAKDQVGFTRTILALSGASALFRLLLQLTSGIWAALPGAAFLVQFVPHVLFAYFLYGAILMSTKRKPNSIAEMGYPALAGGAMGLCFQAYPILAILLFGGILGLVIPRGQVDLNRRLATAGAVSLTCLVGSLVFGALQNITALTGLLPDVLLGGIMGGIFGFYVGVGALPEHLQLTSDPVRQAYEDARRELTGPLLDNAARCWAMYQRILKSGAPNLFPDEEDYKEFRDNLADILLNTFDLSRKWQEVESYLARIDRADLDRRRDDAQKKLDGSSDEVASTQYTRIIQALDRRRADLDKLEQAKERVMSRLEYYFTVLEDLQLSTVRLKSSTAQADSVACTALFEQMEDLSKDLKATSSTLDELAATQPQLIEEKEAE